MSQRWSAGTFLAKATELSRRLHSWHIEDYRHPIQFASEGESRGWVRRTFRQTLGDVNADVRPRPGPGLQFFANPGGELDEHGCVGVAYENPDVDTDRSLTQWLMGDFLRHLEAAEFLPTLDYLKVSFGHVLDLPAWTVREPESVWERSMGHYGRDDQDDLRWYMVVGRAVPTTFLDPLVDAAEKLLATAPPEWGAVPKPAPANADTAATPARIGRSDGEITDQHPVDTRGLQDLVTWLKRVTSEWPPMGVDWPLVLSYAEQMFSEAIAASAAGLETPQEGQTLAAYIASSLDAEKMRSTDPLSRGYAFSSLLLDAFGLLQAYCTASLFMGYDLDAITPPVKVLPPFHALMCLGVGMVEWIRSNRDLSKVDMEAVTDSAPQPVKIGSAFGRNMHQAVWNLANEICQLSDSVTEGHLDVWGLADQQPGTMEDAWWRMSEAMAPRLPDALEIKAARTRLESESRAAFARAQSADPPVNSGRVVEAKGEIRNSPEQGTALHEASPQYVTLDQAAALINRKKKTLERYLNDPSYRHYGMPLPDVEGGGGRPHEWLWSTLRPWLVATFRRELPEMFPPR